MQIMISKSSCVITLYSIIFLCSDFAFTNNTVITKEKTIRIETTAVKVDDILENSFFNSAQPIWPIGRETEMNLFVGFRAVFNRPVTAQATLRITASCVYRCYLNNKFIGYGPARAAHDYWRIDEWDLSDKMSEGQNLIAIEVAGYNANSYYLLDQPSFLQAEIISQDNILASTSGQGTQFEAIILTEKLQKVQRYSFQRLFMEYYRLNNNEDHWRDTISTTRQMVQCAVYPLKKYLVRRVAYPRFTMQQPVRLVSTGQIKKNIKVDNIWRGRSLINIGRAFKGYSENELEVIPSIELQTVRSTNFADINQPYTPNTAFQLTDNRFSLFDLGVNRTGFIGFTICCTKKTRIFITFDEILSGNDVKFARQGENANIIGYEMVPGRYTLESFEPYTLRYIKFIAMEGKCEIENIYLREYTNPEVWETRFSCSDTRINKLFEATRETIRQSSLDLIMDNPGRERGPWLGDGFWTARMVYEFTGNTKIEKNFFENYFLAPKSNYLPDGMIPMCYPADHNDGLYLTSWSLWFVIQLEEYYNRSLDKELVHALMPKVMDLFDFFESYKNENGLLEKLPGWILVSYGNADNYIRDLSYPTNMLYAKALSAAGNMFNKPDLLANAEKIRNLICKQSYNGTFFIDSAIRKKDKKLEMVNNISESCQYYAFFFDLVTPQTHPQLWKTLVEDFGPERKKTKAYDYIPFPENFMGNYMRLELLTRYGQGRLLMEELIQRHLYMAEQTGTMWEFIHPTCSCTQGYASHIGRYINRGLLGIYDVNRQTNTVQLQFSDTPLEWCNGRMPTPDGPVTLNWHKEGLTISYQVHIPAGYHLEIRNLSKYKLVQVF